MFYYNIYSNTSEIKDNNKLIENKKNDNNNEIINSIFLKNYEIFNKIRKNSKIFIPIFNNHLFSFNVFYKNMNFKFTIQTETSKNLLLTDSNNDISVFQNIINLLMDFLFNLMLNHEKFNNLNKNILTKKNRIETIIGFLEKNYIFIKNNEISNDYEKDYYDFPCFLILKFSQNKKSVGLISLYTIQHSKFNNKSLINENNIVFYGLLNVLMDKYISIQFEKPFLNYFDKKDEINKYLINSDVDYNFFPNFTQVPKKYFGKFILPFKIIYQIMSEILVIDGLLGIENNQIDFIKEVLQTYILWLINGYKTYIYLNIYK